MHFQDICRYKLKESQVRAHVDRMLEAVNLQGFAKRQTHTLSGGQKQRVAIAGALVECPKVCLSWPILLSASQPAHSCHASGQKNVQAPLWLIVHDHPGQPPVLEAV